MYVYFCVGISRVDLIFIFVVLAFSTGMCVSTIIRWDDFLDKALTEPNSAFQEQQRLPLPVSTSPYQLNYVTPLYKVNMIFHMLRLSHAFVQRDGTLYGIFKHSDMLKIKYVRNRFSNELVCMFSPSKSSVMKKTLLSMLLHRRRQIGVDLFYDGVRRTFHVVVGKFTRENECQRFDKDNLLFVFVV